MYVDVDRYFFTHFTQRNTFQNTTNLKNSVVSPTAIIIQVCESDACEQEGVITWFIRHSAAQ